MYIHIIYITTQYVSCEFEHVSQSLHLLNSSQLFNLDSIIRSIKREWFRCLAHVSQRTCEFDQSFALIRNRFGCINVTYNNFAICIIYYNNSFARRKPTHDPDTFKTARKFRNLTLSRPVSIARKHSPIRLYSNCRSQWNFIEMVMLFFCPLNVLYWLETKTRVAGRCLTPA